MSAVRVRHCPPSFARRSRATDGKPSFSASEASEKDERRQEYPQGKDVLHSAQRVGGPASRPFPWAKVVIMFYTYILRSLSHPTERYIGSTEDLKSRLIKHNKGDVPHTSEFTPWKVEAYLLLKPERKPRYVKIISNPAAVMFSQSVTFRSSR